MLTSANILKQYSRYCLYLLLAAGILPVRAGENRWAAARQGIDSLLLHHPVMRQASCGIMVYDATDDSVVYRHEEQKSHRPASTTKLFTCAAALKYLSGSYCFRTSLYSTGKIRRKHIAGRRIHILKGNLFVKGCFDPAFSSNDLDSLVATLKNQGIDSITGNLYADVSMKSRTLGGNGWCWDDTGDDFPLLHPLVMDKDTMLMTELPTRLRQAGIGFSGSIGDSICPARKRLMAEKCRRLSDLLPHCLKTSDNRYAESFLYQLGTLTETAYPPTATSLGYVNRMIDSLGVDRKTYHLVDGSGLSPYNYITPETEVALLKHIWKECRFYDEFRSALPIGGIDGTLGNRMHGTAAEGKVYAKTGSLTGTYALAGYAYSREGHLLIFSIMNDGVTTGDGNNARRMQDEILHFLCQ